MLCVPSRFIRNWIVSHYADRLHKLWAEEDEAFTRVDIAVQADLTAAKSAAQEAVQEAGETEALSRPVASAPANEAAATRIQAREAAVLSGAVPQGFEDAGVGAPLDPRFTFDAFVVGK